jgi:hypothetical protein
MTDAIEPRHAETRPSSVQHLRTRERRWPYEIFLLVGDHVTCPYKFVKLDRSLGSNRPIRRAVVVDSVEMTFVRQPLQGGGGVGRYAPYSTTSATLRAFGGGMLFFSMNPIVGASMTRHLQRREAP